MDGKYSWVIRQENIPPALQQEIDDDNLEDTGEEYCAFTVAELGVMLPHHYGTYRFNEEGEDTQWCGYDIEGMDYPGTVIHYDNEAILRADMLILALESEILTAAECNERLMAA